LVSAKRLQEKPASIFGKSLPMQTFESLPALHHEKCHPWVRFWQASPSAGVNIWRKTPTPFTPLYATMDVSDFSSLKGYDL
jgi:hypothetical protein